MTDLLIFGAGYSGLAVARLACERGLATTLASRNPDGAALPEGASVVAFDAADAAIRRATHLLVTAAPGEAGDPVLARYGQAIASAPALAWTGYLSTIGVYGDRAGGWVEETDAPDPGSARATRRLRAEAQWTGLRADGALDLLRLAGIYGPGRSVLDDLRDGHARRVAAPGHAFNRIHRDDIAAAVLAAIGRPAGRGRVLHLSDDAPAESATVIEEAARLLGLPFPPSVPLAEARAGMSEMARSFWAENRKVACGRTKAALGLAWRYPSYREGLRAILAEEALQQGA